MLRWPNERESLQLRSDGLWEVLTEEWRVISAHSSSTYECKGQISNLDLMFHCLNCLKLDQCDLFPCFHFGLCMLTKVASCAYDRNETETFRTPPFLGWGLLPGVDGLISVLEEASVWVGVSVWGLESVLGERSVMAESSEVRGSFPKRCRGRAGRQNMNIMNINTESSWSSIHIVILCWQWCFSNMCHLPVTIRWHPLLTHLQQKPGNPFVTSLTQHSRLIKSLTAFTRT